MNRRNFVRSILGVAAATALPSEVWPFKKIFLPPAPMITRMDMLDLSQWGKIQAIELESFAKEIPNLIYRERFFFELLKETPRTYQFPPGLSHPTYLDSERRPGRGYRREVRARDRRFWLVETLATFIIR